MDVTASGVRSDIVGIIGNGAKVRFRYFNISGADSGYDDDVVLTQSGTDYWTSGLIQPLDRRFGSNDAMQLEQGKLLTDDKRLYVLGNVPTSGTFKIGIGSPTIENEYALIQNGVIEWPLGNNEGTYKKLYIRNLTTGSLMNE